jgi:hypothetical protein
MVRKRLRVKLAIIAEVTKVCMLLLTVLRIAISASLRI